MLHGRSGASTGGLLPLSPVTLDSWTRVMDIQLTPLEAEGLFLLDGVLLESTSGTTVKESSVDNTPVSAEKDIPWPERKQ